MTLDPQIAERANYWATSEVFDSETRGEISQLLESGNEAEIIDRFYRDLEFGTGGLRGLLGPGTSRMNIYNVKKATQALATYMKKSSPGQNLSIAISHDSRRFSREFSETVARVMAANEITAYITKELRPVPMLSFAVRKYSCKAGVCVTASHNPPEYNGYKVYWDTGSQIIPPHDKGVIDEYRNLKDYGAIKMIDFEQGVQDGLIKLVGEDLDEDYFSHVDKLSLSRAGRDNFKIVFTPLHGTAGYPVNEVLKRFGFQNVTTVTEQEEPDGNFPTVSSPNPEDASAVEMAVELAKKEDADLVLATDPDCDRIGIVVKIDGQWIRLNGNQIACLLNEYCLRLSKETGRLPESALVVKTIVTTDLQAKIAEYYGAHCEETLTGFKWICGLIEDYESGRKKPYRKYVCGGEESFGFLADSFVRDKDGVISCALAAEMVAFYQSEGQSLLDVLDDIFLRHGVYYEALHTLTLPGKDGADAIDKIMTKLRENPPTEVCGQAITIIKDFSNASSKTKTSSGFSEGEKLNLPTSNVLQFMLEDGSKISARPSGTEPKIKFYVSVNEAVFNGTSEKELGAIKERCLNKLSNVEKEFVKLAQL